MNEFLPRAEAVASVVSAKERGVSRVGGISAVTPVGTQADANAHRDPQLMERSAEAANYAKLQADIADAVAQLDPPPSNGVEMAAQANDRLMALMPQPVVVLPLPPTDQDMVEFVAQVAQAVASQAARARAAHSRLSTAQAEAALH